MTRSRGGLRSRVLAAVLATSIGCSSSGSSPGTGMAGSAGGAASGGGGGAAATGGAGGATSGAGGAGGAAATGTGIAGTTGAGAAAGGGAGGGCASRTIPLGQYPPDMLLLLDRSATMLTAPDGTMCTAAMAGCSKWSQVVPAVNQAIAGSESNINWGLELFGDVARSCVVSPAPTVAVGPANAGAIAAAIATVTPDTPSPITAGENAAAGYLSTLADSNPKFILMVTDGAPNCGGSGSGTDTTMADDPRAIQAVADAAARGIPTFVVGIGTALSPSVTNTLEAMAIAGGAPRNTTPSYYAVANGSELADVLGGLASIGSGGCIFPITPPPETSSFEVRVGGRVVPRSATDGWDFSTGRIAVRFNGALCDERADGGARDPILIVSCPP